jgi:outer membrane lipoprotein-sorting protein
MTPDRRGRSRPAALMFALVVAVLAVAAVAGGAAVDGPPEADALLEDTRQQYADADSVVGSATVTVANGTANATATVEYAVAGNRSRVAVDRADGTYRAGTNGTVAWYDSPNRTGVVPLDAERQPAAMPVPEENLSALTPAALLDRTLEEDVDAEVLRTGSDDGTEAYVVRVTPANDSRDGQATLWVATDDARLLRVEATEGSNRTVVDVRATQFNVTVHDSTFDPPGDRLAVTAFERYDRFEPLQANTTLDLPRLDAAFRGGAVADRPAGTDVVQQYRAGSDNVTVVSTTVDREFDRSGGDNETSTATVDGREATVTTVREATVVYWSADGVTTAVVLEASEDRALELARQLA